MVGNLLLRGMLVGILAGLVCFCFLKLAGEPAVDRSIAFETRMDAARDALAKASTPGLGTPVEEPRGELVSRSVQAGIGLFTGVVVYGAACGGLFALVFAAAYGRLGALGPRAVSALLAGLGFVSVHLVPSLVYPADPPSVGQPGTIGMRTAFYFAAIALSLAAMIGASMLHRRLLARLGAWDAALLAGACYVAAMVALALVLPVVDEVPEHFPAVVLWQFRLASLGAQILMWTTFGLVFGRLADHLLRSERLHPGTALQV